MFHFGYITKEDIREHTPNWSEVPDHPYRILTVGGSGSGKTNALLNLINHEQITFNHSSDIDFQGFLNLYKKWTAKLYSFLVIDATLAPDNLSSFRKNLLEKI